MAELCESGVIMLPMEATGLHGDGSGMCEGGLSCRSRVFR